MKKFSKKFIFRLFCLILSVTLIFVIPTLGNGVNDNIELIYGTFVGEKSEYNGMIEIWNIDTFESGSISKNSLLLSAANQFQKKYKGIYVLVRNITEKECENMLAAGQLPDMFSCAYGVSEKIKSYVKAFDNKKYGLYDNYLQAGQDQTGAQLGLAWCSGLYFLLSSNAALEKTGIIVNDDFKLSNSAYKLGYKTKGKKEKIVYSLSFANKGYLMPQNALSSYNDIETDGLSDMSFNSSQKFTQYEAYIDFLVGNCVVLLGSQRDVVRLSNRRLSGKISDIVIEPLISFCDLVQYIFMTNADNSDKQNMMQKFAEFLIGQKVQASLTNANMFSPLKNINQEFSIDAMNQVQSEDLQKLEIKHIF